MTDLHKQLDEIAEEACRHYQDGIYYANYDDVCSAIDKALEAVLAKQNQELTWALSCIEMTAAGLRNRRGLTLTDDPATTDVEMWNLNAAKVSVESAAALLKSLKERT